MIAGELHLTQFRSYSKRTFSFSPLTTLLVGKNTAGKTNILESVYMLATGKSFRADQDREVIRWGEEICRIQASEGDTTLEIMITNGMVGGQKAPLKKYLVNGVARRMIDFVGNMPAVLFWPEHLELVTDSPSIRRRYLDSVLTQVDREYRRNLISYERGLRQRNKLLDYINEGTATRSQLVFWNQLLIKAGGYLTDARAKFIEYINASHLPGVRYRIEYDKSVISESRLEQYAAEELSAKATLVGPHRDDFIITKYQVSSGKYQGKRMVTHDSSAPDTASLHLGKYGSRGEQRLAILWMKLAELSFIHEETGQRPILLLDDIFSELDVDHRGLVLDMIGKQQTIITSAEEEVAMLLKEKITDVAIISLPVRS